MSKEKSAKTPIVAPIVNLAISATKPTNVLDDVHKYMSVKDAMMGYNSYDYNYNTHYGSYKNPSEMAPFYEAYRNIENLVREYITYLDHQEVSVYGSIMKPESLHYQYGSRTNRQARDLKDALSCFQHMIEKFNSIRSDLEDQRHRVQKTNATLDDALDFLRRAVKVESITPDMLVWCRENYPDSHMVLTERKTFVFQEVAQAALFKTFWC